MPSFTIALVGLDRVRPAQATRDAIEREFGQLAQNAGKPLRVTSHRFDHARPTQFDADVQLTFEMTRPQLGSQFIGRRGVCGGGGVLIFGNAGGGTIFVGEMLEFRVGGLVRRRRLARPNRRAPLERMRLAPSTSHASQTEPVFSPGESAFGDFVANTVVHELGHMIADLGHDADPGNYMHSGASLCGEHSPEWFTRGNLRRYWSGRKRFAIWQQALLVLSIRDGRMHTMTTTRA